MSHYLPVKPHHFVDIMASFAPGFIELKPHPYQHSLHKVSLQILEDRNLMLRIELGADAICKTCILNNDGLCTDRIDTSFRPLAPSSKRAYNLLLDERWCGRLEIECNELLTAYDLCKRLLKNAGNLEEIYRENPADYVNRKEQTLRSGLRHYQNNTIRWIYEP